MKTFPHDACIVEFAFSVEGIRHAPCIALKADIRKDNLLFFKTLRRFSKLPEKLPAECPLADPLHPFFAFFLLLQQLAFSRNISAVTFGKHVLAQRRHGFARDHLGSDRRLDRDLKHLPWDQFSHLGHQRASSIIGKILMHDDGKRIHGLAGHRMSSFTIGDPQVSDR